MKESKIKQKGQTNLKKERAKVRGCKICTDLKNATASTIPTYINLYDFYNTLSKAQKIDLCELLMRDLDEFKALIKKTKFDKR